jgi:hypothetical protein
MNQQPMQDLKQPSNFGRGVTRGLATHMATFFWLGPSKRLVERFSAWTGLAKR